jgi:ABC-type nitrate/sulfonate/bicarbonate transport system permease component
MESTTSNSKRTTLSRKFIPPTVVVFGTFVLWQLIVVTSGLPSFILPSPLEVIRAARETWDILGPALGTTLFETLIGLIIAVAAGTGFAALMDMIPIVRRALYPLLVASQTIQILAVAPLLVIWFGFGLAPNIIVVVLFSFFPMTVSTFDGLASTDPDYVSLLRSMRADRKQIWRLVRLPAALPSFFSGLKLAVTYSVVAATIGEWVGGSGGLGLYMLRSKNALQTAQVFAAMFITTLLSIGLFLIVSGVERVCLPWYYTTRRREQWEEQGIY